MNAQNPDTPEVSSKSDHLNPKGNDEVYKWADEDKLMKCDAEVYAYVYAELETLKNTCSNLASNNLGGDAIKQAIEVLQDLSDNIHYTDENFDEGEEQDASTVAEDEESLF